MMSSVVLWRKLLSLMTSPPSAADHSLAVSLSAESLNTPMKQCRNLSKHKTVQKPVKHETVQEPIKPTSANDISCIVAAAVESLQCVLAFAVFQQFIDTNGKSHDEPAAEDWVERRPPRQPAIMLELGHQATANEPDTAITCGF